MGVDIRPWEVTVIRDLDDIALNIWRKTKAGDNEPNMISMTDGEGIKALFGRLKAQREG